MRTRTGHASAARPVRASAAAACPARPAPASPFPSARPPLRRRGGQRRGGERRAASRGRSTVSSLRPAAGRAGRRAGKPPPAALLTSPQGGGPRRSPQQAARSNQGRRGRRHLPGPASAAGARGALGNGVPPPPGATAAVLRRNRPVRGELFQQGSSPSPCPPNRARRLRGSPWGAGRRAEEAEPAAPAPGPRSLRSRSGHSAQMALHRPTKCHAGAIYSALLPVSTYSNFPNNLLVAYNLYRVALWLNRMEQLSGQLGCR